MGKITVSNLGKAYKTYPSKLARLKEWVIPFSQPRHKLHWVLQDINFEIKSGEAVGIIGINGAGKSTLLKMLTGTTQPTTGSIEITGRVAALLELGMGFHPDFTGRQNIYMAGQLLGMSSEEVTNLMPEIEAFADIGEYIDQPVRVYSSGMQMRVAFSIATAKRPDLLIVDEALSVGDTYFQHKSFDRIREFRKQGTTLLIVSHDKAAIQSICDRAILLSKGKIAMQGEPEVVMDYYNAMLSDPSTKKIQQSVLPNGRTQTTSGTGDAYVDDISLLDQLENQIEILTVGQPVKLRIVVQIKKEIPRLVLGIMIKDRLGQTIFGTNSHHMRLEQHNIKPDESITFNFMFNVLIGEGCYSLATALVSNDTHLSDNYEWRDNALTFEVINSNNPFFVGTTWLNPELEILR